MQNVFVQQLITMFLLGVTTYVCGLAVRHWKIRVNYTRKIFHFVIFGTPLCLEPFLPSDRTLPSILIILACQLFCLISVLKPVRSRIPFLQTCFSAVDRPEDHPYTLWWLTTQVGVTFLVTIVMAWVLEPLHRAHLMLIPVLVTGIGDGLAEPVGVRFGKHKYRTYGFFVKRTYERSIEGSACVFITAIIAIGMNRTGMSSTEFGLLMAILPLSITLAEALSPHTWDAPAMYAVGGLCIWMAASLG